MKTNYLGTIYSDVLSKYRKFSARLQKNIANGSFWKLTIQKRQAIIARIERLKLRLETMNPKLAGAMIATGFMLTAGSSMAQVNFVKQTGTNNPANAVVLSNSGYGAPVFADIDGDGDKDMIIGDYDELQFYKNTGTSSAPVFTQQTGTNNIFAASTLSLGLGYGGYTVPSLGDIDGDGDLDLVTGHDGDEILLHKNVGTAASASFITQTGTNNIFPSISTVSGGYYDEVAPSLIDIDADGDLDVIIGDEDSRNIVILRNTGTPTSPVLTFEIGTSTNNPFASINPTSTSRNEPGFGDLDKDGDLDMWVAGEYSSPPKYYKNTGTATAPAFTLMTGTNNPFSAFVANGYSYANFVNLDGDGDNDFFVGEGSTIAYYLNTDPTNYVSVQEENISDLVSISPNPATNSLNFVIDDKSAAIATISVLDIRGVEVKRYNSTNTKFTVDISDLASGVYTVKIISENKTAVKKVVKN